MLKCIKSVNLHNIPYPTDSKNKAHRLRSCLPMVTELGKWQSQFWSPGCLAVGPIILPGNMWLLSTDCLNGYFTY